MGNFMVVGEGEWLCVCVCCGELSCGTKLAVSIKLTLNPKLMVVGCSVQNRTEHMLYAHIHHGRAWNNLSQSCHQATA